MIQRRRHHGLISGYFHAGWCKDHNHDGLCIRALTNRIRRNQGVPER